MKDAEHDEVSVHAYLSPVPEERIKSFHEAVDLLLAEAEQLEDQVE